ncbi:hypothetical protein PHMEG_00014504 [Phytophthora megakarya]|uniref:Core-binding (CB) domain-containing protein n=1 Tax=Phytophthora megakarya TaxID=4795 RepID=A0A225W4P8_9STRA|nr:hypothetical protein PHMEG_00014504 [Phytophthora megakarya]
MTTYELDDYWFGLYVVKHVKSYPDCCFSKSRPYFRGYSPDNIFAESRFQIVAMTFVILVLSNRKLSNLRYGLHVIGQNLGAAELVPYIQSHSVPDAKTIRDACISTETRKKYNGNINGIKRWIRNELSKEDSNTDRFFDETDDINLMEFTPGFFEKFLVYKRSIARSVTLSGYRSAIKDLYRLNRIALPLFSGLKRLEADQNQSSSPKTSGNNHLLTRSTKHCWNLMCRSVSVQNLQTQHLSANDDSVETIFSRQRPIKRAQGHLTLGIFMRIHLIRQHAG